MSNQVVPFSKYVKEQAVHDRIVQMLGPEKAPGFISSLVGAVSATSPLARCRPEAIISAALKAVELNMPLGLGQVALVPYGDGVQFQIMKRGWVQFAQRSGEIEYLNSGDVREGELVGFDHLRGIHKFDWIADRKQREEAPIIGYFAYLETRSGFKKTEYWTLDEIDKHALKFSKSYQSYKNGRMKQDQCFWANEFRPEMERKTVLLKLLREWAPMSTTFAGQWADALKVDQAVFDSTGNHNFADNPRDESVIEAEIIEAEEEFKETKASPKKAPAKKPSPKPVQKELTPEEVADFEAAEAQAEASDDNWE